MELSRPFIKLPYRFDIAMLQAELTQFDEQRWMAHPSRLKGNSAIPLISLNGEDNDEFAGQMRETKHLRQCAYIKQVMASFNEVLARSRLMKLDSGCEVSAHVDFNYHWYNRVRIHIPITTHPDVIFYCGDDKVHMPAGECWIFDSWRRHRVCNNSPESRVHLVIDTAGSARFWQRVRQLEAMDNHEIQTELVRPSTQDRTELRTERFNLPPIMAAGEMDAIVRELINDFSNNPQNDPGLVQRYSELLLDLAKDWRITWLEHGYQRSGWPVFQQLLRATTQQLAPQPRALTTASNDVGVNPIIMQRIIRVALNPEQMEHYLNK